MRGLGGRGAASQQKRLNSGREGQAVPAEGTVGTEVLPREEWGQALAPNLPEEEGLVEQTPAPGAGRTPTFLCLAPLLVFRVLITFVIWPN